MVFLGPAAHGPGQRNSIADIPVRCRYATFVAGCAPPDTPAYASANPSTIEPALADASTITWGSTQCNVNSILIQDSAGKTVSTLPVDLGACSGAVVWAPDSAGTPVGTYNVVAQFEDSTTRQTGAFVNVALTVYDVYSYDFSPFYPGDGTSTQNQTMINYQLSGQVPSSNVIVDGDTLQGSGNSGDNTVTWNGTIDTQNDYCASGAYPIAISPQVGTSGIIVGQPLSIASPTVWDISALPPVQTNSFDPSAGEYLEIDYQIAEPVQRPQASAACVTALVYDEDANIVATLADAEPTTSIDTTGNSVPQGGQSTLVWDGTNDNGDAADPGFYTVTIVAEDNAGMGCESLLSTISVQLLPSQACEVQAYCNSNGDQRYIVGSTNSGSGVSWTDGPGSPWWPPVPATWMQMVILVSR